MAEGGRSGSPELSSAVLLGSADRRIRGVGLLLVVGPTRAAARAGRAMPGDARIGSLADVAGAAGVDAEDPRPGPADPSPGGPGPRATRGGRPAPGCDRPGRTLVRRRLILEGP